MNEIKLMTSHYKPMNLLQCIASPQWLVSMGPMVGERGVPGSNQGARRPGFQIRQDFFYFPTSFCLLPFTFLFIPTERHVGS